MVYDWHITKRHKKNEWIKVTEIIKKIAHLKQDYAGHVTKSDSLQFWAYKGS